MEVTSQSRITPAIEAFIEQGFVLTINVLYEVLNDEENELWAREVGCQEGQEKEKCSSLLTFFICFLDYISVYLQRNEFFVDKSLQIFPDEPIISL